MGSNLKSFDFVVYRPEGKNLLVDVKGRKISPKNASLQNWTTREDIDDLRQWQEIFGDGFCAMFVFAYWYSGQPQNAPFKDLFLYRDQWYGLMGIGVSEYREYMRARSEAWGTVHLSAADFKLLAKPFEQWL